MSPATALRDLPAGALQPVTAVVTQRVKPDKVEAFRRWQDGINLAVASFAGFLGTEVVPADGPDGEWTVIYRFDSTNNLDTWLHSPVRQELVERGADLFAAPPSQQILRSEREEGVVVVVSHRVPPGDEEAFLAWQKRMVEAEREFPGFRGSELSSPVAGLQQDWAAIYRFDSAEHLDAWLASPERERLLAEGERFRDFEIHRIAHPFGSWFAFGDDAQVAPTPSWKTALAVLVGLYPTVMLLTLGIAELWGDAELWESLLVGNMLSTALLTWLVMPFVTRALRFWLTPAEDRAGARVDVVGTVTAIAVIAVCAITFWLTTTVFWSLP